LVFSAVRTDPHAAPNGPALARELTERLELVAYAVSLGKTRSLIFYIPAAELLQSSFQLEGADAMSYRDWASDGVFCMSVGIEDAGDIITDLEPALGQGGR
jgi:cystathionine gamma-synthase/methionine-gamma-lyase